MLASRALSSARRRRGLLSGIAAAELRGDRDFLDEPGEDLALLGIRSRLAVLDVRPFAVTRHGANSKGNIRRHAAALAHRQERQERSSRSCRRSPTATGSITGATGTGKTVTLQALAAALLRDRRAGVHGRRERRPRRHRQARRRESEDGRAPRSSSSSTAELRRLPGRVLGRVRQERPSGARDRLRHGPAAALAACSI